MLLLKPRKTSDIARFRVRFRNPRQMPQTELYRALASSFCASIRIEPSGGYGRKAQIFVGDVTRSRNR
jgi:hypothetical protein